MAWRLRKTDAAGDHCSKDLFLEKFFEVLGYLPGQVGSIVKHREQHALYFQVVLKRIPNSLDSIDKLRYALQRYKLSLDRYQDRIGRNQSIEREQIECRRTVYENKVVMWQKRLHHPAPQT